MFDLGIFFYTISFTLFFLVCIEFLKGRYDYLVEGNPAALKGRISTNTITSWSRSRTIALGCILGCFGLLIGLHLKLGVAGPLGGLILLGYGPIFFLERRKKAARQKIQDQVVQMLNLMSSSMRSGKTIPQAIREVSETMTGPLAKEMTLITRQILVGIKPESALQMLEKRVEVPEISLAVKATIISISTGADLPSAMSNIANAITTRDRLERKIKAMTAQGRAQALVMGIAPFVLLAVFYIMSPQSYGKIFTTLIGNIILALVIFLQSLAYFSICQLVKIKF